MTNFNDYSNNIKQNFINYDNMGIPSYFSFIVKNHASIIKRLNDHPKNISHLYLDCNSVIYEAAHNINFKNWTEKEGSKTSILIHWVILKIEEYIGLIKPSNTIFIAFDGVAPVAKMSQQRGRRYKSWHQSIISKNIFKDASTIQDIWNTTAITPGTEFMNELNQSIQMYFSQTQILEKNKVKTIIVSGSDEIGEGEHKIFQYIRENKEQHQGSRTIIYGLDADLIMLSMTHLPIHPEIYLFRETPHFIQTLDNSLEPSQTYMLDIPELARVITLDMCNIKQTPQSLEKQVTIVNRIYDYILICFMLGNDFLPHFPAINIRSGGIHKLLNAYKATIGNTSSVLTDGTKICWGSFRKFIGFLAKQEEEFLKTEAKQRDRQEKNFLPTDTPENTYKKFELIPTYERDTEKFINPYRLYWQSRYYKSLFKINIDDERRTQICVNYLEGLEWTLKYYTTDCPDWRWCYKYEYPPLLEDLHKCVPSFDTELMPHKERLAVSPNVQLSYVLPKSALHLIPGPMGQTIRDQYLHLYPDNCDFVWAYCKYFWESHVELPEINIDELIEIDKTQKFTKSK